MDTPTRRSTRQSSRKALHVEPTPRGPLKRTRAAVHDADTAVNGSRDDVNASGDQGSPSKMARQETEVAKDDSGDTEEMDYLAADETGEINEDQEMIPEEDFLHFVHQPKISLDSLGKPAITGKKLEPYVMLENIEHCQAIHTKEPDMGRMSKSSNKTFEHPQKKAASKSAPQLRDQKDETQTSVPEPTSFGEHHNEKPRTTGFMYLWMVAVLVLLSCAALLAYKNIPAILHTKPRSVEPGAFVAQFSALESRFPGQHAELWRRSRIHLEKHLLTAHPTEPVSLMLTAGHGAERTLLCLAKGLASAFSSALNASVLHIYGATKANQDSDKVKLDIDRELEEAFQGDKAVAVIHRFEELPPGSTLIFYRYCDHENSAYKRVFLAFTVLLPQEAVDRQQSLQDVEEMVQNYIEERFVQSGIQTAFNRMDADKLSGLWSRISHLILPVTAEKNIEQNGC
ncbi:torsin-1A-interacting protein 2-like isoform X3 [Lampris incognitus]|uniref:torsin-1A-interacting protein 2-like isoform X3 n=1 Tax=Lampris incognitus TaxID=2546036 RepID=UPI0024B60EE8|nr:torsin-1A-interacting protein 2-like isoform X3 [Lampris incognitus]